VLLSVPDLPSMLRRLELAGVLAVPMAGKIRMVTHRDVSKADIDDALVRIGQIDQPAT
jgi:threonine aldolase